MSRLVFLIVGVLGATPHPLARDDAQTRQKAAVAWSRKHGPVRLEWPRRSDPEQSLSYLEVRAPKETGCATSIWACPDESSGGMGGKSWSKLQIVFIESPRRPTADDIASAVESTATLLLRAESDDDVPEENCVWHFSQAFIPDASEAQRKDSEASQTREDREYARCLQRERRRAAAERAVLRCEILVVNPCRREAFVRCGGKNFERDESLPQPGVRRFSW